jgi:16S rRNA (guanine966-N2)-methyltransferase
MRVIAGTLKGRTLRTLKDYSIRPMTDRVKQSVFDILSVRFDFYGISVLDLFSGSGSLGIEAISRGAKRVTFVEKEHSSVEILKVNLQALGIEQQCDVQQMDVFDYLTSTTEAFDLLLADPPYKLETIGQLPNEIMKSKAVKSNTYVVMEHSRESQIELNPEVYEITIKNFGQTVVLILKKK